MKAITKFASLAVIGVVALLVAERAHGPADTDGVDASVGGPTRATRGQHARSEVGAAESRAAIASVTSTAARLASRRGVLQRQIARLDALVGSLRTQRHDAIARHARPETVAALERHLDRVDTELEAKRRQFDALESSGGPR